MSNLTFQEIAEDIKRKQPTPLQTFIKEIAELTHRTELTVRMWIWGRQTPDELTKSVIAKHLNTSADVLFPAKPKQSNQSNTQI